MSAGTPMADEEGSGDSQSSGPVTLALRAVSRQRCGREGRGGRLQKVLLRFSGLHGLDLTVLHALKQVSQ